MNPKPFAKCKPELSSILEYAANCHSVLLSSWTACPATFPTVALVVLSVATHFTSIRPLYERYERPTTNNPIIIAATFITPLTAFI